MSIVSSIITTTQLSRSCILTNTKLSEDRHLNNVPKIWYGERDGEHITSLLGNLRPKHLNEYIGQQELKQVLKIAIQATCARKEALDHLLLYGPPGLGKTTIALIIAQELGVHCHIVSAPALERPRDIIGILLSLKPNEILFIDEIHRLNRITEELLYTAMEDYRIDLTIGKGKVTRIRSISISPFTLVGATTKVGSLSSPLVDRFGFVQRLDLYSVTDVCRIIERTATFLGLKLEQSAILAVAQRSRGTPRIANRLLRRIRDIISIDRNLTFVSTELVNEALSLLQVDSQGLDSSDRRLLQFLLETYSGGPVGLDTLAAGLGEDPLTIESVIEPFLLQVGFLKRTHRGRIVTKDGCKHLGWY